VTEARFTAEIGAQAPIDFANLSGDWNPLHTDSAYAAGTPFGRPVLHGAYLTGLMSRLAGMHLPGEKCLLHGVTLRFVAPLQPPATVTVVGRLTEGTTEQGRVSVRIVDAKSGATYAEGHYDFGVHVRLAGAVKEAPPVAPDEEAEDVVLVTGASGGLAQAVLARLPPSALGVSRSGSGPRILQAISAAAVEQSIGNKRISAIIHCAWPFPDNESLTELTDVRAATAFNLASPVNEMIELAQLLKRRGTSNSTLVLIGSAFADPGRHNYRMPLYSLTKSLVPQLARILATELAVHSRRCVAVVFDVIEGGMNKRLSAAGRAAHRDRSPFGQIASADEAAAQLLWVLQNDSFLASGSTLALTGAAVP
jgi:acyl dehydratase/NAD(P)-dependent dehydrogenase (short-subunit alcohol dehydrogenase family)